MIRSLFTGPGNVRALKKRKAGSHKGENGSVLIVAGSRKFHGAEILAAKTASLFADLVFVLTEKENLDIAKKATPLIIASELSGKNLAEAVKKSDSVLIGPGLSVSEKNRRLVNFAVKSFPDKRFVLDAAAVRLIEAKNLHSNCLVTPHAEEFSALSGKKACDERAVEFAKENNCIVLLKGKVDIVTDGSRVYWNNTGNALMTAGGTGDVLAGCVCAIASGNPLFESALAGSYLVGLAGDIAESELGLLNAEKLIDFLPKAFLKSTGRTC